MNTGTHPLALGFAFDATIISARFKHWDYNGHIDHPVVACEVKFETPTGSALTQVYSVGRTNDIAIYDDKGRLDSYGLDGVRLHTGNRMLSASSNFALFVQSVALAGLNTAKLDNDIRVLEGLKGKFERIECVGQRQMAGNTTKPARTILVCKKLYNANDGMPVRLVMHTSDIAVMLAALNGAPLDPERATQLRDRLAVIAMKHRLNPQGVDTDMEEDLTLVPTHDAQS